MDVKALGNRSEALYIFQRRHSGATALHLNENDLEVIAALSPRSCIAMILADGQQVDHANGFTACFT